MNKRSFCGIAAIALAGAVVAGCAANPTPVVDTKGVDPELYAQDRAECEQYTDEINMVEGAAKGAAAGVAIGAAYGVVTGDVPRGAAFGGIGGGSESALEASRDQQKVWKNCMKGRGYRVLN